MSGLCWSPGDSKEDAGLNQGSKHPKHARSTTDVSEVFNVFIYLNSSGNLLLALLGCWAGVLTSCMG